MRFQAVLIDASKDPQDTETSNSNLFPRPFLLECHKEAMIGGGGGQLVGLTQTEAVLNV